MPDIFFIKHVLRLRPITRLLVPCEYVSQNGTCTLISLSKYNELRKRRKTQQNRKQ